VFNDLRKEFLILFLRVLLIQDAAFLSSEADATEEMFRIMAILEIRTVCVVPTQIREHDTLPPTRGAVFILQFAAHESSEDVLRVFELVCVMDVRAVLALFHLKAAFAVLRFENVVPRAAIGISLIGVRVRKFFIEFCEAPQSDLQCSLRVDRSPRSVVFLP